MQTIYTRLSIAYDKAVANKQYLDVSNLKINGVGIRYVKNIPRRKSKKKHISGFDIISDNYGSYKLASDVLGKSSFAQEYYNKYVLNIEHSNDIKEHLTKNIEPRNHTQNTLTTRQFLESSKLRLKNGNSISAARTPTVSAFLASSKLRKNNMSDCNKELISSDHTCITNPETFAQFIIKKK